MRFVNMSASTAAEAVARCSASGAHYAPVFRAVAARQLAAVFVNRHATPDDVPISTLRRHPLPVLAILHDDDYATTGPAGFPVARKLLRWSHSVVVHGAAGLPEHYFAAANWAALHGNCVMVETSSAMVGEWGAAAARMAIRRRMPIVSIRPPEGAHPVAPVRH